MLCILLGEEDAGRAMLCIPLGEEDAGTLECEPCRAYLKVWLRYMKKKKKWEDRNVMHAVHTSRYGLGSRSGRDDNA